MASIVLRKKGRGSRESARVETHPGSGLESKPAAILPALVVFNGQA